MKDVEKLVSFTIRNWKKIECIWSSKEFSATGTSSTCWLQSLQNITISGCPELHAIFERIPNYTFGVLPVFCLKKLEISGCHNLKNVFPSSRLLQLLQNLEHITIRNCNKLEELIGDEEEEEEETETPIAIPRLKKLEISLCHNLKKVFPSSRLLQLLLNIEKITIKRCSELEELIGDNEEEETETPIALPRLQDLKISKLPKLKRICSGAMICDSLEWVSVKFCFELKRFPEIMGVEQLTPPPALRSIIGNREWWDSLEWDPFYPKSILQPFFLGY